MEDSASTVVVQEEDEGSFQVPIRDVSFHSAQGGRKYMEDVVCGVVREDPEPYAFFAVYDGHGGNEAAAFAAEHLHGELVGCRGFWEKQDDDQVLRAIRDAFMSTHRRMWKAHREF